MKSTTAEALKIVVIGTGLTGKNNVTRLLKNNTFYTVLTIITPKNDYNDITYILNDADMVIITTCLNDICGMQISSHLSKIIKVVEILTISVIPQSLYFNSRIESQNAKDKLLLLEKDFDAVISPGIDFLSKPIRAQPITETLSNLAVNIIDLISGIVVGQGKNDINLNVEDLKIVLRGKVLIGSASFSGKECKYKAMNNKIRSSLFDDKILTANGILVSFLMHPDFPISGINDAMRAIEESVDGNANILFGTTTDEALDIDYIQIRVMGSFYEDKHK
jgi:cell division protein FtsZ